MFDFSFGELALIGAIALVVLGPERLPRVARTVGDWLGKAQRYVSQVKADIHREMELAELKKLDAGSWYGARFAGERIPTLDELLAWARDRVAVAVEIKNGPIYYPGIAEKIIAALYCHDMTRRAILISFDHRVVREAKALASEVLTGILYVGRLADPVAAAHAARADALHPQWAYITG